MRERNPSPKAAQWRAAKKAKVPTIPRVDWDALAPHYRAGVRSLKDIGAEFDVSDAAIIKHARKEGWTRDLAGKVKAKADAMVRAALVSAEVSAQTAVTEQVVVEVEAQVQARIRLQHRIDIKKARELVLALLAELEGQTHHMDLVERLRDALLEQESSAQGKSRLVETFQRLLGLPGRADTMKKLAETLRIVIDKEREAYGIESAKGANGGGLPMVTYKDLTGRKSNVEQAAKEIGDAFTNPAKTCAR